MENSGSVGGARDERCRIGGSYTDNDPDNGQLEELGCFGIIKSSITMETHDKERFTMARIEMGRGSGSRL